MFRFEVTLDDGWKVRVNADCEYEAARKAEHYSGKGASAVAVERCDDVVMSNYP